MAILSTQLTISTVFNRVVGPGATAIDNDGVSAQRPMRLYVQNFGTTRAFISPTSAGTTNDSYVITSLNVFNIDVKHGSDFWFFTSAGAAARMGFMGGLQA
jgi:hypothetical protein